MSYQHSACFFYFFLGKKEFTHSISEKKEISQALVAHACNPSYSGGRDQEDVG
jgi:hypothetical protein